MREDLNGPLHEKRHEHASDSAQHATCPASGLIIAERALIKGRQDMLPSIFFRAIRICSGAPNSIRLGASHFSWLRRVKCRWLKAGPTLCLPPNVALKTIIGPISSIGGLVALPPDQRNRDARHSRPGVAQGRQDMPPSISCSGPYGFVRARRIPSDLRDRQAPKRRQRASRVRRGFKSRAGSPAAAHFLTKDGDRQGRRECKFHKILPLKVGSESITPHTTDNLETW